MNQLISVIGSAANIELRNIFISAEDQYSLINQCDAYISLHRSEGLGLGMAEAMYLKKPVDNNIIDNKFKISITKRY